MEHPLLQDVTMERVIKYAADFMQIVGVPKMFDNKTAKLEVTKYKAELPCDFYSILGVRMSDSHIAFRATTDIYHLSDDKESADCPWSAHRCSGVDECGNEEVCS